MLPSSNSPKKLELPVVAMFIKSIVLRLDGAIFHSTKLFDDVLIWMNGMIELVFFLYYYFNRK